MSVAGEIPEILVAGESVSIKSRESRATGTPSPGRKKKPLPGRKKNRLRDEEFRPVKPPDGTFRPWDQLHCPESYLRPEPSVLGKSHRPQEDDAPGLLPDPSGWHFL